MKILLAYISEYRDRNDYYMSLMPSGLTSIASYLQEKGHDVKLANYSASGWKKGAGDIIRENPDALGVSIFSFNRTDSFRMIKKARASLTAVKIIIGGPHATFLSGEIMKRHGEIDYIVAGEGELALSSLLDDMGKGVPREKIIHGGRIDDLDTLPAAPEFTGELSGVNTREQYKYIITSRGCPGSCTFCSSPAFWERKVRYRSAEHVFNEIKYIHEKYGIIYFSIRDDNFTLNKKRVLEFSKLLQKSGIYLMWNCQARVDTVDQEMLVEMKRAGLEHIQYGVESGSGEMLRRYGKSIDTADIIKAAELTRNAGIYLSIYLMTGMEGEGPEDIRKTVSLMKKVRPGDCIISPVAYYPGTALYNDMKNKGKIRDAHWFENRESGLYVRDDNDARTGMAELAEAAYRIASSSGYGERDFAGHRLVAGDDCWVTDIMEGDMFMAGGYYDRAEKCLEKVIQSYPGNIWGFYRMGQLKQEQGEFPGAVLFYKKAQSINPEFYGTWMNLAAVYLAQSNLAQSNRYLAQSNRAAALEHIEKAYQINSYHKKIKEIRKKCLRHGK